MLRAALLIATGFLAITSVAEAGRMPRPAFVERDGAGVCPVGASGCADPEGGIVYRIAGSGAFARSHEIGHVFDEQALTDPMRAWLTPQLGFAAGSDWDGAEGPAERFADAYASCDLGHSPFGRRGRWVDAYGYMPRSARALRRVCDAIIVYGLVAAYER